MPFLDQFWCNSFYSFGMISRFFFFFFFIFWGYQLKFQLQNEIIAPTPFAAVNLWEICPFLRIFRQISFCKARNLIWRKYCKANKIYGIFMKWVRSAKCECDFLFLFSFFRLPIYELLKNDFTYLFGCNIGHFDKIRQKPTIDCFGGMGHETFPLKGCLL